MKKMLTVAAFSMLWATVANAAYNTTIVTFETELGNLMEEGGGTIESIVLPDKYSGAYPSEGSSTKYYAVSNTTGVLRKANSEGTAVDVTHDFYMDMVVKFSETRDFYSLDSEDKLAIYMNTSSNLVVVAGGSAAGSTNEYVATAPSRIEPDKWYRVSIRMFNNVLNSGTLPAFKVAIDGTDVQYSTDTNVVRFTGLTETAAQYYNNNTHALFPSLKSDDRTVKGLAFVGLGAVDDIVFREDAPVVPDVTIDNPTSWAIVDAGTPTDIKQALTGATVDPATLANLGTGTYKIQASSDSGTAQSIATYGVTKINNTTEKALISVPWQSLDGANVRVRDMFLAENLVNEDMVGFYVAKLGGYVWYTYNNGEWTTGSDEYSAESTFAPGTAALFWRKNTSKPIVLVGKKADGAAAPSPAAGSEENPVWTAIGSTAVEEKTLSAAIPATGAKATGNNVTTAKDMVVIQNTDGTYSRYFLGSDGKWKTIRGTDVPNTVVIRPGTGFMYRSESNTVPTPDFN